MDDVVDLGEAESTGLVIKIDHIDSVIPTPSVFSEKSLCR